MIKLKIREHSINCVTAKKAKIYDDRKNSRRKSLQNFIDPSEKKSAEALSSLEIKKREFGRKLSNIERRVQFCGVGVGDLMKVKKYKVLPESRKKTL